MKRLYVVSDFRSRLTGLLSRRNTASLAVFQTRGAPLLPAAVRKLPFPPFKMRMKKPKHPDRTLRSKVILPLSSNELPIDHYAVFGIIIV